MAKGLSQKGLSWSLVAIMVEPSRVFLTLESCCSQASSWRGPAVAVELDEAPVW
jgi:hypothetical protein